MKGNRQKRFRWAQFIKNYTMNKWKQVLWTDKSKFEVLGNKQRIYVRRSAKEKMLTQCLVSTVKHSEGSMIVWGCFSLDGVGDLHKSNGTMRKEHYRDILKMNWIDELDRKIRTVCPTSKSHLWNIIEQEWNNIQKETIRKLIKRMPRIVKAVIKSKGDFFDEKKI